MPHSSEIARLLDGLNPAQGAAVTSGAMPLAILAGAGSGKTRVLTRRIAHRILTDSANPSRMLALTFTRKAAGELSKRLNQLGVRERVATGTFHAIAYAQLRQWWADTNQPAPQLVESKMRLVAPLVHARKSHAAQPVDVVSEIEWAKARLIRPEHYAGAVNALGRKPPLGVEAMAAIYARYEAEKKKRGIVDFDDLLSLCVRALETDREFAARQRWQFRHVFVDEFQDVNPAQYRLLEGWLGIEPGTEFAEGTFDLCVVGDPNQAIYAWNGADPRFLTQFAQRFASAEVIRLEDNYRSTPQILTVADAILGMGQRESRPLRANRPDGVVPSVTDYASDLDEAKGVARSIRDRHSQRRPWSQFAVLTRTNAQALLFEEAFRAVGIPHKVRGGGMFLAQPEIKNALGELRRSPGNVAFASRIIDLEEMVTEALVGGTTGPEGTNERAANLEGLVRLANEFVGIDPMGSTASFLQWVNGVITSRADEPDRGGNLVEITTFHRAKGLEWPVVFVAGLERGYVPIGQADNQDAWDEERRLLYVAVTRAEQELHCSWAKSRTFGSRTTARTRSPWVDNIDAARLSGEHPADGDWRAQLRLLRERADAAKAAGVPGIRGTKNAHIQIGTNADPKVLEVLKKWRAGKARATGVPAFVIFHDTTLAAVAEAQPDSHEGLLALPGVGSVKVDRYGDEVIAVLAAHRAS